MLIVKVSDTGVGINQEDYQNLFKMFGKLKDRNGINVEGVGLGLTICKKLCEAMGGSISVTSILDQGTTFTFSIVLEDTKN